MKYPLFVIFSMLLAVACTSAQTPVGRAQIIDGETPLSVYMLPNDNSEILRRLSDIFPLIIIGRSADNLWLQVQLANETSGWVVAERVQMQSDLLAVPVTNTRNVIGMDADLDEAVVENIRRIYRRGQDIGRDPHVFSKVGDSITVGPHSYTALGTGEFQLASFDYLRPTVSHYAVGRAHTANPFINDTKAAAIGWSAPAVLDPRFADAQMCLVNEAPLLCEYRLSNPSVALIMFGTNDVGFIDTVAFYNNMEQITQISIEQGIIPVISTIPDRVDYEGRVADYNEALIGLADAYNVPLWDYGAAMRLLPDGGLTIDGVHPTIPPLGVRGTADFRTNNLAYGYVIRNLTGLQMLDAVRRAVADLDEEAAT